MRNYRSIGANKSYLYAVSSGKTIGVAVANYGDISYATQAANIDANQRWHFPMKNGKMQTEIGVRNNTYFMYVSLGMGANELYTQLNMQGNLDSSGATWKQTIHFQLYHNSLKVYDAVLGDGTAWDVLTKMPLQVTVDQAAKTSTWILNGTEIYKATYTDVPYFASLEKFVNTNDAVFRNVRFNQPAATPAPTPPPPTGTPVDLVPAMTSNNAPIPFVASASTSLNSSYDAWKAFDGIDTSHWVANAATGQSIQIDLGGSKVADLVKIKSRTDGYNNEAPKDFIIQGCNDGVNWINLSNPLGISFLVGEEKSFSFNNTVSYRFYRISITSNNGNAVAVSMSKLSFLKQ